MYRQREKKEASGNRRSVESKDIFFRTEITENFILWQKKISEHQIVPISSQKEVNSSKGSLVIVENPFQINMH